jgi:glyoxylase-like metal-dependent hydrolase (beta-lactamase superfamily II)
MQIIPLSEGAFTVDKTKQFVPFSLHTDHLQQRPIGSLLVEIQPFVIITARDILVLDTGLGFADEQGEMQIHKNLLKHGINEKDVTKVLISHLHKDHASGITNKKKSTLSFTNATYFVNKQEFDFANENATGSYKPEDFSILKKSEQVKFIEGSGIIDDYITYEITGAHCPYHQVFWVKENEEKIFFGGDVAPQLQQMKNKFIAKYDYDGRKCMELRKQWWQQGAEEKWTFLFYHDIKTPVFKF